MRRNIREITPIKKITMIAMALLLVLQILPVSLRSSAAGEYVVLVTSSSLNVRSGPGTSYGQVGLSHLGDCYDYIGEKSDSSGKKWYQVRFTAANTGWIASQYSIKTKPAADYTQAVVDSISASYGAAGVQVAVVENGAVTDTYNYGWATKNSDRMTSDHKIRVASISKVAVAIGAMKMQEQGIVDIGANIGKYWGASPYKAVTLKSLLTHTSTLKALGYNATRAGTLSQLKSSDSYSSGTVGASGSWMYNNYAVGVAGSTLEVAANKTLDSYAKSNIFAPLGMDASFMQGSIKDTSRLATLYYPNGSVAVSVSAAKKRVGSTTPGNNVNFFSGGLTCSAKDLAKLMAMLANDGEYGGVRILSPSSVSAIEGKLFTKSANGGTFYQCMPLRYKAGLYGESGLYYHTGNAYGVLSLASYNPDTRDGVVVITTGMTDANTSPACGRDSQGIFEICGRITQYIYKHHRPTIKAESISIDKESIELAYGQSAKLSCSVTPADANEPVIWTSSGKSVSVDGDGNIKAVGYGTAVITAATSGAQTSCTVTVAPDISIKMLGASIRVSDPYGIRFGIQLDKNECYNHIEIKEYGTLIIGAGNLGSAELTLDTPNARRIKAERVLSSDSKCIVYTGVLVNIPESFFDTNVTARGYIICCDADGNQLVQYTSTATKSFKGVAAAAYDKYSAIQNPTDAEMETLAILADIIGAQPSDESAQPDDPQDGAAVSPTDVNP